MTHLQKVKIDCQVKKLLFFGGVYSNIHALKALKKYAIDQGFGSQQIFSTGDIAGYCAFPNECFELIEEWGVAGIKGNVEENLLDGKDDCGCNFEEGTTCDVLSKNWFSYTSRMLSEKSKQYISTLPSILSIDFAGRKIQLIHGSYPETAAFVFDSTPWSEKQAVFEQFDADIVVGGHCGLPFISSKDAKAWINPGVIGMPANDGEPFVWFMTLTRISEETRASLAVNYHRISYNYQEAARAMLDNCLPGAYAKTILTGLWDNCDILPPEETSRQGRKIGLTHCRI
ncbi:metallophosphoesterase family protein [Mongoliitalea lutea]|uniref:Calcineurin-like phosphoesterase domain-containing protein n=1 Tax=Mongoliitalea lutea TaxID=849756 RepID=A0A8J3D420_9BACT|nr:metallophosphoesterase family protein [Mongoliitalea lutea]GHB49539.1 hypothetical protein GCM10008106_32830 [Mongoliitalea lutea]